MKKKLTFKQVFNAMKIFIDMYFQKNISADIATILGALRICENEQNGDENEIVTFDGAAWDDWMDGVKKTMEVLNIKEDPKKLLYDEEVGFLCMKNYLQLFNNQFHWEDIESLLNYINRAKHVYGDKVWNDWLQAIDHSINETYQLDQ